MATPWSTQAEFELDLFEIASSCAFFSDGTRGRIGHADDVYDYGEDDSDSARFSMEDDPGAGLPSEEQSGTSHSGSGIAACEELWRHDPERFFLGVAAFLPDTYIDRIALNYAGEAVGVHAARIASLRRLDGRATCRKYHGHIDGYLGRGGGGGGGDGKLIQEMQTAPARPVVLPARTATERNRRFRKLAILRAEGDYFSVESIKDRHPQLFDEFLGADEAPEADTPIGLKLGDALREANHVLRDHSKQQPASAEARAPFRAAPHAPEPAAAKPRELWGEMREAAVVPPPSAVPEAAPLTAFVAAPARPPRAYEARTGTTRTRSLGGAAIVTCRREDETARRAELVKAASERFLDGYDGAWVDYSADIDGNEDLDDNAESDQKAHDAYFDY